MSSEVVPTKSENETTGSSIESFLEFTPPADGKLPPGWFRLQYEGNTSDKYDASYLFQNRTMQPEALAFIVSMMVIPALVVVLGSGVLWWFFRAALDGKTNAVFITAYVLALGCVSMSMKLINKRRASAEQKEHNHADSQMAEVWLTPSVMVWRNAGLLMAFSTPTANLIKRVEKGVLVGFPGGWVWIPKRAFSEPGQQRLLLAALMSYGTNLSDTLSDVECG